MASDWIKISSDEDIGFDEWHFVTKSSIANEEYDEEYSDDGSIEIIERETLPPQRSSPYPSPPSSPFPPSNASKNYRDYLLDTCDESGSESEDGIKITKEMLASSIEESPENENSPVTEPEVPLVENFDETVDSADHCDCPVVDNQPVMMYYFSRKVFYSCMVAAFASIIVHQYRDYLIDEWMSNVYRQNAVDSSSSALGDAPPVIEPSLAPAEFVNLSSTDFIFRNIDRDENDKEILEERNQLEDIFVYHFSIPIYMTYLGNSDFYSLNISELFDDRSGYDLPSPYNKLLFYLKKWEKKAVQCDDLDNIISAKLPMICRQYSYVVILLKRHQYLNMMENIFIGLHFENTKLTDLNYDIVKTLSKDTLLKLNSPNRRPDISYEDSFDDDDSIRVQKHKVEVETLNEKPTVINSEVKNQKTFNIEENILNELPSISPQYVTESPPDVEASRVNENIDEAEAKLDKLIHEIKVLLQKFEKEWRNFYRFQMLQKWKTEKCKHDLCAREDEVSAEKTSDLIHETDKVNSTYGEKVYSDSISGFIYDTVPITDRWSIKMNAEKSKNAIYDRPTGEWILRLGKAREKLRKRYKHKQEKKRSEKSQEKKECKICKSYQAWLKKAHDKVRTDYKKIKSQVKTKFKKLSEGVKQNYEKLISSDWKHYAQSIFQRFHL